MTTKDFFERDRFAKLIGAELIETADGYAKACMQVEERHLNGGDVCQGGAIFTLADLAAAAAVNSHGILTFAITTNVSFIKSAPLGCCLYAEAHEVVNHHKVPYVEVRVTTEDGDLIAAVTQSCYRKKTILG